MLLRGKKVKLRALEPEDLELLYAWENDTRMWMLSDTVAPFSRHVLLQYIETAHLDIYTNKQLRLMIDLQQQDFIKTIGCIDLFDFDPRNHRAGIGILIGDMAERNKGYAADALQTLIEYAFNTLQLHQLYCNITIDNNNSLKLFTSAGFEIVGVKKQWIYTPDAWLDEYLLQKIADTNK